MKNKDIWKIDDRTYRVHFPIQKMDQIQKVLRSKYVLFTTPTTYYDKRGRIQFLDYQFTVNLTNQRYLIRQLNKVLQGKKTKLQKNDDTWKEILKRK